MNCTTVGECEGCGMVAAGDSAFEVLIQHRADTGHSVTVYGVSV